MALKLAIKSGLAYSAMHYACSLGVWGNSVQADKLYNEFKDKARPHVNSLQKQLPFDVPNLPQTGEVRFLAKHYYNNGVKSTFQFIIMLPCYAGQLIKKTKDAINKTLEAPAAKN
ncbi:MICOS complex subunit MIC13 homolog QIL1 [Episyrphus balteatus]|uniref:MICOS complex subunit MIC13 homolog QIL1 n=1 Tax=Episyrphus balteatus TaxID=286459 RepID=UPI0024856359|nr:MICOS complex subunit MIC13 homolog QIL1 [Episyrphus balteatus]